VSIVLKSGSLNLLEPSGPVQACNGISLPHYWEAALHMEYKFFGLYMKEGIKKCYNEHIMNTIIYVSTTYLLKQRLHVSTQHYVILRPAAD